ncbi:hypothetical protein Tsubulata_015371 [Turnera subulata]|uniref:Retrotransposon Copia-like N-terminal domain-containing protein n=1 Tax=Turnera subulata TaxID=218843 RepID=A0A9Q0GD66_9ROSI|nr:hypothetical protein Tsubulata_015371 [Turnera subulata]
MSTESSLSSSSTSSSPSSSSSLIPLFSVSSSSSIPDIQRLVSVKLDLTNYLLWKSIFLGALRAYAVEHHVTGVASPPSTTLSDGNPNPLFAHWWQQDNMVLTWIYSTVSLDVLRQVYDSKTKSLCDSLHAIGHEPSDFDFVLQVLNGLPEDYDSVVNPLLAQRPLASFEEIRSDLLSFESRIARRKSSVPSSDIALAATVHRGGYRGCGRGWSPPSGHPSFNSSFGRGQTLESISLPWEVGDN